MNQAERQTGLKLKILRTDNGTEYNAVDFEETGVVRERTAPYIHHQNGTSERMNRTILTMIKSMLAQCGAPPRFWDVAFHAALYIRNILPVGPDGITPYEAWTGKRPNISNLRVWGSIVYILTPMDDPKRYKLDMNSRRGVFVGYTIASNQYLAIELSSMKVFRTSNLYWIEGEFPTTDEWNKGDLSENIEELLADDYTDTDEPKNTELMSRLKKWAVVRATRSPTASRYTHVWYSLGRT
jgi:hypothetical protein